MLNTSQKAPVSKEGHFKNSNYNDIDLTVVSIHVSNNEISLKQKQKIQKETHRNTNIIRTILNALVLIQDSLFKEIIEIGLI